MAIGMSSGAISVLALETATAGGCLIYESAFRKDCKDVVSDVKFSPNQGYIAAGSHDDAVYVYSLTNSTPTDRKGDRGEVLRSRRRMSLHPLHRLKGHSSYLTHIDWSRDEALLRSTCGAYELLLWDLSAGKLATGATEADIKWDTHTCVLGFNVMGIWPKYSDGTDVNAVSVSRKKNLIATADDFGLLSLFNYPCVVSGAPCRKFVGHRYFCTKCLHISVSTYLHVFVAHSSHVPNVSFNGHHDEQLVTVGGQDGSVIVWSVRSI